MYNIVVLIGSTKFVEDFRKVEEELSLKGYLVFTPSVFNQSGDKPGCGEDAKKILDTAAKMKISRSDIVFVIDKDKYIGKSTKDQINYAKLLNKPILYYSKGDVTKL
jgi:dienelactone hydrolase